MRNQLAPSESTVVKATKIVAVAQSSSRRAIRRTRDAARMFWGSGFGRLTTAITHAATSDLPLQKPSIRGWGASDGSPSSGFGIANQCDPANVSCATTGINIEHGVSGIGSGAGIQAVAGSPLVLAVSADACITGPQLFGRWMFRVGRCPRAMLQCVVEACNISQQGIQGSCR